MAHNIVNEVMEYDELFEDNELFENEDLFAAADSAMENGNNLEANELFEDNELFENEDLFAAADLAMENGNNLEANELFEDDDLFEEEDIVVENDNNFEANELPEDDDLFEAEDIVVEHDNNLAILNEPSSDEELADSDYDSDMIDNEEEEVYKALYFRQVSDLNEQTKMCCIYFYYNIGNAEYYCTACFLRIRDIVPSALATRKHLVDRYDGISGVYCENCRGPVFQIFPCNLCPMCTSLTPRYLLF